MKKSIGIGPLIFPTPVWVVGTYDKEGKPNAMTAAWGGFVVPNHRASVSPFKRSGILMKILWREKLLQ